MRRLSHTPPKPETPETVGAAIERCARALARAHVHFGHGTDNARDDAYGEPLSRRRRALIDALLEERIKRRVPLAYLTHRAFFAGLELYVDERVIVPRSPIAELIAARFAPWIASRGVRRILDMGTGSGAIALACAEAFPHARVDAVDISTGALAVARRNLRRLELADRVKVLRS